jgi:heme-degrading monooxygenase HmoA
MYAVIFQAEFRELDQEYIDTAARMRELAKNNYGCLEFISVCEGNSEIAISYWETEEQIQRWKHDKEHLLAQERGKSRWYKTYRIQIVEVKRAYSHSI